MIKQSLFQGRGMFIQCHHLLILLHSTWRVQTNSEGIRQVLKLIQRRLEYYLFIGQPSLFYLSLQICVLGNYLFFSLLKNSYRKLLLVNFLRRCPFLFFLGKGSLESLLGPKGKHEPGNAEGSPNSGCPQIRNLSLLLAVEYKWDIIRVQNIQKDL